MEKTKIRTIYEYEYRRGTTTRQTADNINTVFGEGSTNKSTVADWFKKFKKGDFSLENEPRGKPEVKVNNEDLKAVVERDPTQSAAELASQFKVSKKTMLVHLAEIGKKKKLNKWIPHELNDGQKRNRLDAALSLLTRHKNEPILERILTCDEKWILYDDRKRKYQWLDADESPGHEAKPDLHQKKLMVTIWWSRAGIVHHSFMKPGTSITAETYCMELEEMTEQLKSKQPKLFNRLKPLLLHDNARPHTAKKTVTKLQELKYETLRHPPYSPDLSPSDYYLFRNLGNFLVGKSFASDDAVKSAFKDFIDSREPGFYRKGIDQLPEKWQKCIDALGAYFD